MQGDIGDLINRGMELLEHKRTTDTFQLETKASSLLQITAELAQVRHGLEQALIKARSVERASAAKSMFGTNEKTVTEKKLRAETDVEYTAAREDLEDIENNITYIKSMMEIFRDGHIFYRRLIKEDF